MSSNGLLTSRWADDFAVASADVTASDDLAVPAGPIVPAASWVGLAQSHWADPAVTHDDYDDNMSINSSITDITTTPSMISTDSDLYRSDSEDGFDEDPTDTIWRGWVRDSLALIHPAELEAFVNDPTLLYNIVPLPTPLVENLKTAILRIWRWIIPVDEQLATDLTTYIRSFSPTALRILDDQLSTYIGRFNEDEEETGLAYDGKYGRECGLWMERLRQRDLRGELAEFA